MLFVNVDLRPTHYMKYHIYFIKTSYKHLIFFCNFTVKFFLYHVFWFYQELFCISHAQSPEFVKLYENVYHNINQPIFCIEKIINNHIDITYSMYFHPVNML